MNSPTHKAMSGSLNQLDEDIDGEAIVLEGFRRTRERTNWLYRGSALTTSDRMDIDTLREHTLECQDALGYIASVFAALMALAQSRLHNHMMTSYHQIKRIIHFLDISVAWITCYIETLYLDIEDRLYFVHRERRFVSPTKRSISSISDDNECESLFGFKKNELQLLLIHLRIPDRMRMSQRSFTGEEALLIFLYYIRTGTPFTRMAANTFGGDPRRFTYYIRSITDHLYSNFYNKISGDSMRQWLPHIQDFRTAIWNKLLDGLVEETRTDGTEIDYEVYIPLHTFRVFGWLDDTDMETTRPRAARTDDTEFAELRDTQQAFYK